MELLTSAPFSWNGVEYHYPGKQMQFVFTAHNALQQTRQSNTVDTSQSCSHSCQHTPSGCVVTGSLGLQQLQLQHHLCYTSLTNWQAIKQLGTAATISWGVTAVSVNHFSELLHCGVGKLQWLLDRWILPHHVGDPMKIRHLQLLVHVYALNRP